MAMSPGTLRCLRYIELNILTYMSMVNRNPDSNISISSSSSSSSGSSSGSSSINGVRDIQPGTFFSGGLYANGCLTFITICSKELHFSTHTHARAHAHAHTHNHRIELFGVLLHNHLVTSNALHVSAWKVASLHLEPWWSAQMLYSWLPIRCASILTLTAKTDKRERERERDCVCVCVCVSTSVIRYIYHTQAV